MLYSWYAWLMRLAAFLANSGLFSFRDFELFTKRFFGDRNPNPGRVYLRKVCMCAYVCGMGCGGEVCGGAEVCVHVCECVHKQ